MMASRPTRLCLALMLMMLVVPLLTRQARAAAPLEWSAPAGCPDREAAHASIAQRVGAGQSAPRIQVEVWREGPEYVAEVELQGEFGRTHRTMRSPSCDTVLDAVGLVAHVMSDAVAAATRVREVVPQPPATAFASPKRNRATVRRRRAVPVTTPTDSRRRDDSQRPTNSRSTGSWGVVGIRGIVGAGILPGLDVGGSLVVAWQRPRVRIELSGTLLAPRDRALDGLPTVGGTFWAGTAGVRGCPLVALGDRGRLDLGVCGALEAGAVRGRGRGSDLRQREAYAAPWVALGLVPALWLNLTPRLRASAEIAALVPVVRSGFTLRGAGEVHRPGPAAFRVGLGIEVRFP